MEKMKDEEKETGVDAIKSKAKNRLAEMKADEDKEDDVEETKEEKKPEADNTKALKALDKDRGDLTTDDAAEILLAAAEIQKDSVLMKEVNILMKDKKEKLEKITSLEQLKDAALNASKEDPNE